MGSPLAAQRHAGEFRAYFAGAAGLRSSNLNSAEECRVPVFAQRPTINNK
jgi:hypothetical protein